MKQLLLAMVFAGVLGSSSTAHAGVWSDALGKCFVESSSPKDRATLVQWMFAGLSMNPAVRAMTSASAEQREESNRAMGKLFDRLLLAECRKEAVAALRNEGVTGFQSSFETFGKVAAQSLMSDPAASAELDLFVNYTDTQGFSVLLKDAGIHVPDEKK